MCELNRWIMLAFKLVLDYILFPINWFHARISFHYNSICYHIRVFFIASLRCTRENTQLVTNLQQTCSNAVSTTYYQDVFALLVPTFLTSCQWLVDNSLYNLVDFSRLGTSCSNNLLSSCNSIVLE
jgi:hypothetical protein